VSEYGGFTAVDDVKVNGKLTLGENTADNGGLVLAFMAYMDRAKKDGIDLNKKIDGYTAPQRFYIAYAQNWCQNERDEAVREAGADRSAFAGAVSCGRCDRESAGVWAGVRMQGGAPMVPANACRVW